MPALTIDGHHITVQPGTTVLEAAGWLGIRIPTMCRVPGIEPAASCFLCAVQIEGRRTLSPACAMPAADGMVVITDSPDIRTARKLALELLLSDHAGDCVAPCAAQCPAGLDIPGFVHGIATRDHRDAARVIAERLALPGSLGRICPRLCEQHCRRCDLDQGLAIGALHRYVANLNYETVARAPSSGKSVAIVGAGPAGLAAAYYLLRQGHACTLFDAHPQPGGMLRYGIPAYRLPKDALDLEIGAIRKLGAQFHMGQRWGEHFTLAGLRQEHDAVFLAIGAQRAQQLGCTGDGHALPGIALLQSVARGNPPALGDDVIVVGGGNTAIDCARSAVRLGAHNVRVLYRRSRQEMPCLMEEVDAAEAEGVALDLLVTPVKLEPNGRGVRLTCQRMALGEPDASGRRRPVAVPGSEFSSECSTVIAAIGQSVECALAEREGLAVTAWGIAADARTLAANLPGVFAGGDAVLGADLAVRAVAAGRIAAASIGQYLSGADVTGEPHLAGIAMHPVDDAERAALFRAIEQAARVRLPQIPVERRRTSFEEVEHALPAADAVREARRCLTCGCRKADCCLVRSLATEYGADVYRFAGARRRFTQDVSHPEIIYEPGKCICCGACVRVAAAEGEELGLALVGRGFDVSVAAPFGMPLSAGLRQAAQRCAVACPTGALALRSARA
ncbi:MAG TPA: FAD-dependent oxidoreductase [Bryobacteraceae bacterium]|jgi:formate dehydrogenase major subunit|nr:FAD-dependent oxidoreductase [Bryobacteraceae bacterium]